MQTGETPQPPARKRWRLWRWVLLVALGGAVWIALGIIRIVAFRHAWIEPLPDVRTEMTRPFVKESELGPESAYKLLLQAVAPPVDPAGKPAEEELFAPEPDPEKGWESVPEPVPVWEKDWSDALAKFRTHPWPAQPPPPAAETPPPEAPGDSDELDDDDGPWLEAGPLVAPWTLEQVQDIERLAKLYEPKLAILDRALAAPDPQMPTADNLSFLLPYLADVRSLARWLAISAHYRAAHGDYAGAGRDLERTLAMGNLVSRGGTLIGHLVGVACQAIAADATWTISMRHDIPGPVRQRMARAFLTAADEAEPIVEAMRAEWVVVRGVVPWVYQNATFDMERMDFDPSRGNLALRRLGFRALRLTGSTPEATARNLESCYQHLVALADQPYSVAIEDEYDFLGRMLAGPGRNPRELAFRTRDPLGLVLAAMLVPALGRAHCKLAERDATLGGMALFLAVQTYKREHGQLPEALDRLVPDYLPRVPTDPFGGKPFRYLRRDVPGLPTEAWAVYSIGADSEDDGGDAHSIGKARDENGDNFDIVWPSQEYPPPSPESGLGLEELLELLRQE